LKQISGLKPNAESMLQSNVLTLGDSEKLSSLSKDTIADISKCVTRALEEDIGTGDITAMLIPYNQNSKGEVVCRDQAVICGCAWVDEVFRQIDPKTTINWLVQDGDQVMQDQLLFTITGSARTLLTGERTALNFLQLLSGTATQARHFAGLVLGSEVKILDTRKTVPGLRLAQKYAVSIGGCYNHRIGLYDAFLIKENHIAACGGIALAVAKARELAPDKVVEVEVENLDGLNEALDAKADIVMLDNFSSSQLEALQHINFGETKIEISGNITSKTVQLYPTSSINYISSGSLTKHIRAVDLSMRLVN
jgi:nicotinate-nucleotide pyrophosphorylase (carboxylating)